MWGASYWGTGYWGQPYWGKQGGELVARIAICGDWTLEPILTGVVQMEVRIRGTLWVQPCVEGDWSGGPRS